MVAGLTIMRVLAPNPGPMTGPGTNTLVVGDATGCLVIDPGCDDMEHLAAVRRAGDDLGGIQGIFVTHAHPDHVGGAAELAAETGAPVLAFGAMPDATPFATRIISDGDSVAAGAQTVIALATPGHRFDHLVLWHAESGTLFAGDLISGVGTVVINPPEGDMTDYLLSLARMQSLPLKRIWPGHGPAIEHPQEWLAHLVAHRQEREALVLTTVREAHRPITLMELVPIVYADTDAVMYPIATRSLLAHLLKLERDGRITHDEARGDDGPWFVAEESER
jgi:glyoxylase-like metal-dependent hydrolase (beta-lactamase superfamily II)